jgi:hypothetical protein
MANLMGQHGVARAAPSNLRFFLPGLSSHPIFIFGSQGEKVSSIFCQIIAHKINRGLAICKPDSAIMD